MYINFFYFFKYLTPYFKKIMCNINNISVNIIITQKGSWFNSWQVYISFLLKFFIFLYISFFFLIYIYKSKNKNLYNKFFYIIFDFISIIYIKKTQIYILF